MRGLILNGSNFQSEIVSSCVMSFPVTGKELPPWNLSPPRLPALRESEGTAQPSHVASLGSLLWPRHAWPSGPAGTKRK